MATVEKVLEKRTLCINVKNGMNAANIVRNAAKAIKGGGGGQPGFAQAGGKDAEGLGSAMDLLLKSFE